MGKAIGKVTDFVGLTDIEGTEERAAEAARQQREGANIAAQASVFRPIGMTTRFGSSNFRMETDPATGLPRVVSAGYTVDPNLVRLQDRLLGFADAATNEEIQRQVLAQQAALRAGGERTLGLAQQYLATSPEAARQQYISEQTALLDPIRRREEDALARTVFGRGRAGLSVGARGQPELATLAEARRTQDLQLAAAADRAAQQRIGFGTGLFGTGAQQLATSYALPTQALGPLQTFLGTTEAIEAMGQQPFNLGLRVGGLVTDASGSAGRLLGAGMSQAATTQQAGAQAASNQLTGFMNNLFNSAISGYSAGGGGGFGGFGGGGGMTIPGYQGQTWGGTTSNPWYG